MECLSLSWEAEDLHAFILIDCVQDSLKDEHYGISMPSVKMRKIVQVMAYWQRSDGNDATTQVYQWQESEDSVSTNRDSGDHDAHVEKSYSYATDWVDHHIDSSNFANTLGEEMRNKIYSAVQQL